MAHKMMRRIVSLGLIGCMALGLTSCKKEVFVKTMEMNSVNDCSFLVPEEFYNASISYEDVVVNNFLGKFDQEFNGIVFEYDNIFSIDQVNQLFTLAVYSLPDHYDLNDLTAENTKETLINALDTMSFNLSDSGDKWGIDTSSEFYKNLTFDTKKDVKVTEDEDGSQRALIPYKSVVALEEVDNSIELEGKPVTGPDGEEKPAPAPFENEKKETLAYFYHGYLSLISNDTETRVMMIHCLENENIDIKKYAESLHFQEGCGSEVVFDEEELMRINDAAIEAMNQTLIENGFQVSNDIVTEADKAEAETETAPEESATPEVAE